MQPKYRVIETVGICQSTGNPAEWGEISRHRTLAAARKSLFNSYSMFRLAIVDRNGQYVNPNREEE